MFDVASARAVAPLDRLLAWSMPLLVPGGQLLAVKGERAAEELQAAEPELARFGVREAEVVTVGHGKVEPPATLVRVVAGEPPARGGRGGGRRAPGGQGKRRRKRQ